MAALDSNPELLIAAFIRMVRKLFGTVAAQTEWLEALQQQALIGSATGVADVLANLQDFSAATVASEGSSTQWLREIPAHLIAQLCESALQRIAADEAAGGDGLAPSGNVRGIDFSRTPCVMG